MWLAKPGGERGLMEPTLVAAPPRRPSFSDAALTRRHFLWMAASSTAALAFYAGEIARHELEIIYLTITLPAIAGRLRGHEDRANQRSPFPGVHRSGFPGGNRTAGERGCARPCRADRRLRQQQPPAETFFHQAGLPMRRNSQPHSMPAAIRNPGQPRRLVSARAVTDASAHPGHSRAGKQLRAH